MIGHIRELVSHAIEGLQNKGTFELAETPQFNIERTRDSKHGDYACNVALMLAKPLGMPPRQIAETICAEMTETGHVAKTEVAGPGFINFFLTDACRMQVVKKILQQREAFGDNSQGEGQRITVEFVSANPTGPLHVGHGRGAAFGSSLTNVLRKSGYQVHDEYYVNDHGRQMDILATSVWLRYLELCGETITFPVNGYKGEYIYDIARKVRNKWGDDYRHTAVEVFAQVAADEGAEGGDKEKHIDDLIVNAKDILGKGYGRIFKTALKSILKGIEDDLEDFNVLYDEWFSEKSLHESDAIDRALAKLEAGGHLYKKEGALWFNATHFGDEKDRVVMRENGLKTYFASDIAYLMNKFERGFDQAIYVFGADHHGYIARLKAAAKAMGFDPENIVILLVQFAHLFKGGEKLQMSTRSGQFVTLAELVEEVGCDAARFFYVMRSHDQHLDFDLDLAKSQSNDNPVYYIQYAHARICSIFKKLETEGQPHNEEIGHVAIESLKETHEQELIRQLAQYPDTIQKAGQNHAVNTVANYLRELAQAFHSYYNAHQVRVDNENLRNARLNLCEAVRIVLANGLAILGASAPESMHSEDKN